MNLNKFKKLALTTKKAQQITGGSEPFYYCYNPATGVVDLVRESQISNYPYNNCMIASDD